MISSHDNVSMALFCDFENVALGVRDANYEKFDIRMVLERLLLKGSIVIKKAYCDWDRYKAFKAPMHEANFELIEIPHVRQSGKNSADIRLVVDALDLCYTKSHVNTFVIISGDSDFSPLVSKLRENAKHVIGVGVKHSTSDLLIANCDEFIFYDDLVRENARSSSRQAGRDNAAGRRGGDERRRKEDADTRKSQAIDIAVETFDALVAERGDTGKIWASALKDAIKRRKPDFNESYYGFRAFGNLLEEAQSRGLLDVGRDEKSGTYVYRSNGGVMEHGLPSPTAQRETRVEAAAEAPAKVSPRAPVEAVSAAATTAAETGAETGTETGTATEMATATAPDTPPAAAKRTSGTSRRGASRRGGSRARTADAAPPASAMEAPLPAPAPDTPAAAPAVAIQGEAPADAAAPQPKTPRKTAARPRRARKTAPSSAET